MHLVIRELNGKRREALVLAVGANRLRVVIAGERETIELRRNFGDWCSDSGAIVQLEAIVADGRADLARFHTDLFPAERAVGGMTLN
jgi:hypothetical protein